jgi:uncharacterized protein (DUF2252 family)
MQTPTTTETSRALGHHARHDSPRSAHADWRPAPGRRDPVAVLLEEDVTRTSELVPIRHGRMLRSPFAFFRGAAGIMAADLAHTPVSGVRVQLCGDAHAANFGIFAAPDRHLVFDVNDFDETLPGPWEWDVKRLAASLAIAGRERGLKTGQRRDAVRAAVRGYREAMRAFAVMRTLDVWYARFDVAEELDAYHDELKGGERKRVTAAVTKAQRKDSLRALSRLTTMVDGRRQINSDPPLLIRLEDLAADFDADAVRATLEGYLAQYRATLRPDVRSVLDAYRPVDMAHKVVGVGSVGMQAWIVLLLGRDDDDPLFLQIKEAGPSVLERYAGASRSRTAGARVVRGQQLMQAAGDVFLGWISGDAPGDRPRDYYVRQLWDAKGSVPIDAMGATELERYGSLCGWTLARAHARAGDRTAIAAYLGRADRFDDALATFAERYADQNERDHAALQTAVARGDLAADTDR